MPNTKDVSTIFFKFAPAGKNLRAVEFIQVEELLNICTSGIILVFLVLTTLQALTNFNFIIFKHKIQIQKIQNVFPYISVLLENGLHRPKHVGEMAKA